jgi:hypothetical protein
LVEPNKVGEGWVMAIARGRGSLPRSVLGHPARAIWWVRAATTLHYPKRKVREFTRNLGGDRRGTPIRRAVPAGG